MTKKELDVMESNYQKYHKSIPDFPILEAKQRRLDLILSYVMAFLVGVAFVLMAYVVYLTRGGL